MVQIIPRQPDTFDKLIGPLSEAGGNLAAMAMMDKQRQQQRHQEQEEGMRSSQALRALLPEIPEQAVPALLKNPKLAEALLGNQISQRKEQQGQFEDVANYEKVRNTFGPDFAEIWRAAPQGGKTELLKMGIDAKMRGLNIQELLNPISQQQAQLPQKQEQNEWPNFEKAPEGFTPKDWRDERKTWRKENVPVFQDMNTALKNNNKDLLGVKNLTRINESRKLPEGFDRLLINPENGEFYGVAQLTKQVPPEAQEWVKEVARFQNRAKDAFGARVTNFDLQSYMRQFPGLLNTYEGRKRILEMLNINYELDNLYNKELKKVYQHYGLNGIPFEEADKLAQSKIKDKSEALERQYLALDQENQQEEGAPKKAEQKQLTEDVLDKYLQMANDDPELAAEMARRDGYVW